MQKLKPNFEAQLGVVLSARILMFIANNLRMCIINVYKLGGNMRTNIVIDDKLMNLALKAGKFNSKREAVENGLKLLIQMNSQKKLLGLEGKIQWEGNLEEMRKD